MIRIGIALIGGGVYAASLAEQLAGQLSGPPVELRFAARRFDRLKSIAAHAAERVAVSRPEWRVDAFSSVDEAVRGALVIVLMIRVGGLRARAHDETFPTRVGLVGDEGIGVGGMANAWRTVPVLTELAHRIRRVAPEAMILNLVAPLGITTRRLLDERLRAVGVCELPFVTREKLLGPGGRACDLAYAGLNHLGWFWAKGQPGKRLLADAGSRGLVDRRVLEEFHAAPLHYYYDVYDVAAGRRLGRTRRTGRAEELAALDAEILAEIRRNPRAQAAGFTRRSTPWFDRAVVPMTSALLGGSVHRSFADVRNTGLVPCVPADGVVEVEAEWSRDGVVPKAPDSIPEAVSSFLQTLGECEALTYRAATERDPALLSNALHRLPFGIPEERVPDLVSRIVTPVA